MCGLNWGKGIILRNSARGEKSVREEQRICTKITMKCKLLNDEQKEQPFTCSKHKNACMAEIVLDGIMNMTSFKATGCAKPDTTDTCKVQLDDNPEEAVYEWYCWEADDCNEQSKFHDTAHTAAKQLYLTKHTPRYPSTTTVETTTEKKNGSFDILSTPYLIGVGVLLLVVVVGIVIGFVYCMRRRAKKRNIVLPIGGFTIPNPDPTKGNALPHSKGNPTSTRTAKGESIFSNLCQKALQERNFKNDNSPERHERLLKLILALPVAEFVSIFRKLMTNCKDFEILPTEFPILDAKHKILDVKDPWKYVEERKKGDKTLHQRIIKKDRERRNMRMEKKKNIVKEKIRFLCYQLVSSEYKPGALVVASREPLYDKANDKSAFSEEMKPLRARELRRYEMPNAKKICETHHFSHFMPSLSGYEKSGLMKTPEDIHTALMRVHDNPKETILVRDVDFQSACAVGIALVAYQQLLGMEEIEMRNLDPHGVLRPLVNLPGESKLFNNSKYLVDYMAMELSLFSVKCANLKKEMEEFMERLNAECGTPIKDRASGTKAASKASKRK